MSLPDIETPGPVLSAGDKVWIVSDSTLEAGYLARPAVVVQAAFELVVVKIWSPRGGHVLTQLSALQAFLLKDDALAAGAKLVTERIRAECHRHERALTTLALALCRGADDKEPTT